MKESRPVAEIRPRVTLSALCSRLDGSHQDVQVQPRWADNKMNFRPLRQIVGVIHRSLGPGGRLSSLIIASLARSDNPASVACTLVRARRLTRVPNPSSRSSATGISRRRVIAKVALGGENYAARRNSSSAKRSYAGELVPLRTRAVDIIPTAVVLFFTYLADISPSERCTLKNAPRMCENKTLALRVFGR